MPDPAHPPVESPSAGEPTAAAQRLIPPSGANARRILFGFALGVVLGAAANLLWGETAALDKFVRYVTDPAGQIWLRALIMIVVPLVFAVLSLGVAELGDVHKFGRIGMKTLLFFVLASALTGALGLALVDVFRPGSRLAPEAQSRLLETYRSEPIPAAETPRLAGSAIQTLVNIVPRNPIAAAAQGDMLGVIFFSIIFGLALGRVPLERGRSIRHA